MSELNTTELSAQYESENQTESRTARRLLPYSAAVVGPIHAALTHLAPSSETSISVDRSPDRGKAPKTR